MVQYSAKNISTRIKKKNLTYPTLIIHHHSTALFKNGTKSNPVHCVPSNQDAKQKRKKEKEKQNIKQTGWWLFTSSYSLFHFLVGGVGARVEDTFGQVLDETDSLGDANLLLLGQLVSQTTLTWVGMVHWQWLGTLLEKRNRRQL